MKKYFIGIDLGGMSAKAGLMDSEGIIHCMNRVETNPKDAPETTIAHVAALARELISEYDLTAEDIAAVGIGSPGVIDSAKGVVVRWTNFAWDKVKLAAIMKAELGVPVFVTNDANAAALGEAKYGSGKEYEDSVMITLGTGIGGGIVIGGKLFEGFKSAGAELGHTVIRKGGIKCTCGRRGCFECYASATALKRETRNAMKKHPESRLWDDVDSLDDVSGKTAFIAARQGDKVAMRIVREYIKSLGEGIVNIVNLLRPEVVMIGGGISNEGDNLILPVKRFVYRNIYASRRYAPLQIVKATLGNDAGVYGAAAYAMARIS